MEAKDTCTPPLQHMTSLFKGHPRLARPGNNKLLPLPCLALPPWGLK